MQKLYKKLSPFWWFGPFLLMAIYRLKQFMPNSDMWFLIDTGRYIVNNGIPSNNVFTHHPDFAITVQQWATSVIYYQLYDWFGLAGHLALCLLMYGVTMWLFYVYIRMFTQNTQTASLALFAASIIVMQFMTNRPFVFTIPIFLCALIVLKKWHETQKHVFLLGMLPLAALQTNFQSAMWPMLLVFTVPYWFPHDIPLKHELKPALTQWWKRNRWLFLAMIGMCASAFLNPQGLDNVLYTVKSYTQTMSGTYIHEMAPPVITKTEGIAAIIAITLLVRYVANTVPMIPENSHRKHTRIVNIFFAAGTILLAIMHHRNFCFLALGCLPLLIDVLDTIQFTEPKPISNKQARTSLCTIFLIPVLCCAILLPIIPFGTHMEDSITTPYKAVEYLDSIEDKDEILLFNGYNSGGFLEWHDYKVYIDARAEIYAKSVNGQKDILDEYMKLMSGQIHCSEVLSQYPFTHLIAYESVVMAYLDAHPDYQTVVRGNGYNMYVYAPMEEK